MGRGSALATALPTEKAFCGFLDDDLAAKFFGVVALLIVTLCFGLIEWVTGSGKLPSSTECSTDPQFMNFEGNDLIKGGIIIEDTPGQPGTLQCCQKCSVMPGAVQWVYHTPLAIGGHETCFCKSKIGTGDPNQQYIAVKIANPASTPWGGAFLSVLSSLGLVYLLVGVLINQQRGLRDMDMIPNGSQWAALPSYVIDGIMFASTGCSSSARSNGYGPVGPASAVDGGALPDDDDVPSMLPDVESLGAQILERDEKERKARKKAAKKSKQKRGSVPSLTDEMQREKDRQKLKDKDKRSRRNSHAVASSAAGGH